MVSHHCEYNLLVCSQAKKEPGFSDTVLTVNSTTVSSLVSENRFHHFQADNRTNWIIRLYLPGPFAH